MNGKNKAEGLFYTPKHRYPEVLRPFCHTGGGLFCSRNPVGKTIRTRTMNTQPLGACDDISLDGVCVFFFAFQKINAILMILVIFPKSPLLFVKLQWFPFLMHILFEWQHY